MRVSAMSSPFIAQIPMSTAEMWGFSAMAGEAGAWDEFPFSIIKSLVLNVSGVISPPLV
jgi:hypothetical protein